MDCIEIVHLRAYSHQDRDKAALAFHQLSSPDHDKDLKDIRLFRNFALDNDLSIFISRQGEVPERGKSSLGLQMAAAFSQFGQIYHSVWIHHGRLTLKDKEEQP